jgi:hypothetical protein
MFNGKNIDPLPILYYIQEVMNQSRQALEKAINELNIK